MPVNFPLISGLTLPTVLAIDCRVSTGDLCPPAATALNVVLSHSTLPNMSWRTLARETPVDSVLCCPDPPSLKDFLSVLGLKSSSPSRVP